jgi:hypothetical protein
MYGENYMDTHFKKGDRVIINSNDSMYRWTKQGSTGTIVSIGKNYANVLFDFLTGPVQDPYDSIIFEIHIESLSYIVDSTIDMSHPNYKVINKVNQMYRRRKELGYAF